MTQLCKFTCHIQLTMLLAHSIIDFGLYIKPFRVWHETFDAPVVIPNCVVFVWIFLLFFLDSALEIRRNRKINSQRKKKDLLKIITTENINSIKYFTCVNVDGFSHTIFSLCVLFFTKLSFHFDFFFCLFVCLFFFHFILLIYDF